MTVVRSNRKEGGLVDDKDRTLKALEDMKESMAYAVRRRATADVVTLEAQVLALQTQLERVERETIERCIRACASERLQDPVPGSSDYSYEMAIDHCVESLRRICAR